MTAIAVIHFVRTIIDPLNFNNRKNDRSISRRVSNSVLVRQELLVSDIALLIICFNLNHSSIACDIKIVFFTNSVILK